MSRAALRCSMHTAEVVEIGIGGLRGYAKASLVIIFLVTYRRQTRDTISIKAFHMPWDLGGGFEGNTYPPLMSSAPRTVSRRTAEKIWLNPNEGRTFKKPKFGAARQKKFDPSGRSINNSRKFSVLGQGGWGGVRVDQRT